MTLREAARPNSKWALSRPVPPSWYRLGVFSLPHGDVLGKGARTHSLTTPSPASCTRVLASSYRQ